MGYLINWLARYKSFLRRLAADFEQAICAAEEARARRHGWQVTRTGFGARSYRDPRYDVRRAAVEAAESRCEVAVDGDNRRW